MENPFAKASKKVNPEAPESSPESLVRRTPEGEEYSLLPEYHQVIKEIADNANLSIDQVQLAYQMEGRNVWTYGLDHGREIELPYTKSKIEASSAASLPEGELDEYDPDSLSPHVILNVETGKPEISNVFGSFKWKIGDNSKVTIERNGLNISFDPNIEDGLLGENPSLNYEVDGNLPVDQVLRLEDFIKDNYLSGLTKSLRHVSYRKRSEDPTGSDINPVALEMRERKQKLYQMTEDLIQDLLRRAHQTEEKESITQQKSLSSIFHGKDVEGESGNKFNVNEIITNLATYCELNNLSGVIDNFPLIFTYDDPESEGLQIFNSIDKSYVNLAFDMNQLPDLNAKIKEIYGKEFVNSWVEVKE